MTQIPTPSSQDRRPARLYACGALLCLISPPALADTQTMTLDQQLVSAPSVESTTVAEMARFGSKVEIIDRAQIERAGPDADITRVLQMSVPGLYVAPKTAPSTTPTIRCWVGATTTR